MTQTTQPLNNAGSAPSSRSAGASPSATPAPTRPAPLVYSPALLRRMVGLAKAGVPDTGFEPGKFFGYVRPILGTLCVVAAFVAECYIVGTVSVDSGVALGVIVFLIVVDFVLSYLKEGGLDRLRIAYAELAAVGGIADEFEESRLRTLRTRVIRKRALMSLLLIVFALAKATLIGYEVSVGGRRMEFLLTEDFYVPALVFALTLALHLTVTGKVLHYWVFEWLRRGETNAYLKSNGVKNTRDLDATVFDSPEPLLECDFGAPSRPHRLRALPSGSAPGHHRYEIIPRGGVVLDEHFASALNAQASNSAKETLKRALLRNQLSTL